MIEIKDITRIAIISSMSFILSLLEFYHLPNGGGVSLYLFPLMLAAIYESNKNAMYIALVTASLQILLGGYFLNPIQIVLDYYLPVLIICLAMNIRINTYFNFSTAFILMLFSNTLSGILFYGVNFTASISYNMTFFIPTIIINLIVFNITKDRFKVFFR